MCKATQLVETDRLDIEQLPDGHPDKQMFELAQNAALRLKAMESLVNEAIGITRQVTTEKDLGTLRQIDQLGEILQKMQRIIDGQATERAGQ